MAFLVTVICFLAAAGLTRLAISVAIARGVMDVPNLRSSHTAPTPRGGGVAIVVVALCTWLALCVADSLGRSTTLGLIAGGVVVAVVGFLDDKYQLAANLRLAAHFIAGIWGLYWLGGLPPLQVGDVLIPFGLFGYVIGSIGIVWTLNLFNFMDGIDGLAASEAAFILFAAAGIVGMTGGPLPYAWMALAAACLGFLVWNWPPAKVFMGDAGSGFLGYSIALLAISHASENSVALLVWVILGGVFFVDATVTLIRRVRQGRRFHEAHRTHAYQWLSRRWGSHRKVTLAVLGVNLFWLLPLAWGASRYPSHAYWLAILALSPLVLVALLAGAGRPE